MRPKWVSALELKEQRSWSVYDFIEIIKDNVQPYKKTPIEPKPLSPEKVIKVLATKGLVNPDKLFFKRIDIDERENQNPVSGPGKISAYALSKCELFKRVVPAIIELGIFCHENKPAKEADAVDAIFMNHPDLSEKLWKAIWWEVPVELKRKTGQSDKNIKARKK
jgi:hypothetical protein